MAHRVLHRAAQAEGAGGVGRGFPHRFGVERAHVAPGVARQMRAGAVGVPVDRLDGARGADRLLGVQRQPGDARAQRGAQRRAWAGGLGRRVLLVVVEAQRQQGVEQFRLGGAARRVNHALDHHPEHAQRDVGALHMAAQPEQIVGDAA